MENNRPYWKVIVSLIFSVLATTFVVVAGVGIIKFFIPFVIGWFIASIANPVVCWLDKRLKIKKKLGSAIMIVVVLGAIIALSYWLISVLIRELGSLISNMPAMYEDLKVQFAEVSNNMNKYLNMLPKGLKNGLNSLVSNLGGLVADLLKQLGEPTVNFAGGVAKSIPSVIIGTFVTVLSAYFFVADREVVVAWFKKMTPKPVYDRLTMVGTNLKTSVGGYFKAQFKIMLVVAAILLVGLAILKVKYALLFALLIAFVDFLPFFGTGAVFVPWCIYTLFDGDFKRFIILLVLYVTTQVVRQTIQPKLVGDEVGLNPLPTLVFIYIGYRLGGVLWMILAVPIGIILINMIEAGAFDYIFNDVKILIQGIKSLREDD